MREFLKGLELDRETIDTIMAEYGKSVQGLREQVESLREERLSLTESSKSGAEALAELQKYREAEAQSKAKHDDELLTSNIMEAFKGRTFASDYAKAGLVSDIKNELSKPENAGKSISEISDYLTKDKEGIFTNPNRPADMPAMEETGSGAISKEAFDKMSYMQRVELKNGNPELYESLKN